MKVKTSLKKIFASMLWLYLSFFGCIIMRDNI
jgi:hypothetical protein